MKKMIPSLLSVVNFSVRLNSEEALRVPLLMVIKLSEEEINLTELLVFPASSPPRLSVPKIT